MKNKNLAKFSARQTHKRRSKDAARRELLRAVEESGTDLSGAKIKDSFDMGRRARTSSKQRRDETVADGVYTATRSGFGFVRVSGEDIFIPQGKEGMAIDGDTVEIVYHRYVGHSGEEKTEGRVRKILEYGRRIVIGEVEKIPIRHGRRRYEQYVLVVDGGRVHPNPDIIGGEDYRVGDKVEAKLCREGGSISAKILRNFGDSQSRGANYQAILAECDISTQFTDDELYEAENVARVPVIADGRLDLRDQIIFTIDGEGAKDLDDAVSVCRTDSGFVLCVHIADVSYYVKEKTPLDRLVMQRATSVYFTDKVVPMLPETLSNGACSLNAGEDKYAITAKIELDSEANILSLELSPTVIRSCVRGVYSEINRIFDGTASEQILGKYSSVLSTLWTMRELYEILKRKHEARGAIDFEEREAIIVLDDVGDPCEIIPRERGLGERMIEQFMLTANEAVATELYNKGIPCVYRVHSSPPEDKLIEFVNFVHNLGFDTSYITSGQAKSHAFRSLLEEAERRGLSEPVSYSLLRTMSKAKYSDVKEGHYGLGIENYCHFTSPIRRLSDLATHRIIRRVIFEGKAPKLYEGYARRAAAAATDGELRAVSAERRIEDLYKTVYMSEHIGETFSGRVSSVTQFGAFVMLENTCEGLVPISEMDDYFYFDEKNVSLVSKKSVIRLGDRVDIVVEECDVSRGKLRFSFA